MVKINRLNETQIEEYKEYICNKIKNKRSKLEKSNECNIKYKSIVNDIFQNCEILIAGHIEQVIDIYEKIREKYPDFLVELGEKEVNNSQKKFNDYICKIFDYKSIFGTDKVYDFINKLDIHVCPYCNRNYITVVRSENGRRRPDLDHFFPKSKYPLLSLSISNLIPTCSYCNGLKSNKMFSLENNIYPYNEGIEEIEYFDFEYGKSLEEIRVILKNDKNDKTNKCKMMNENAKEFLLEELYNSHKDIVKDIIEKSQIYNKFYCEELNNITGIKEKREITEEEIKYFLGYTNKENIKNTSLAKFKNDIINTIRK